MTFTSDFLNETVAILSEINHEKIEQVAQIVHDVREANGRLFILGVGGSAGHVFIVMVCWLRLHSLALD